MKSYHYLLFDLDGTLTDSKEGITKSVAYALDSFGIKVNDFEELEKLIGPPLEESFMESYHFTKEEAEKACIKYRERFSTVGLYENRVYDGMENFLKELCRNGYSLIVTTSKPYVYAKKILSYFGLDPYFIFLAGSELDGTRKKKSEVIAYAIEQCQITDQAKVLMIGDRKYDILGAKENGIDSMGVLFGYGDRSEHEKAGADFIVESIEEMRKFLIR